MISISKEKGAVTQAVGSPCISICALDANDVCVGCLRTAAEITCWSQAGDAERKTILADCMQRAAKNNPFI